MLSQEDMMTLALRDSAYGEVKQSIEGTKGETPIFKQLDIDVID